MAYTENYFTAEDGIKIYYRKYGQYNPHKPTIICLAGLTRNSKSFHHYAEHCVETMGTYLICPDMRGRGQSDYDSNFMNYNPLQESQDILNVINHENLKDIILIGTSRGGMQSAILAGMIADKIKGVILNDIGVVVPTAAFIRLKGLFSANTNFVGDYQTALRAFYAYDKGMTKNLTEQQEIDIIESTYKMQGEYYYLDYDYVGLGQSYNASLVQMNALTQPLCDLKALFATLSSIPTLLLQGENSDILPLFAFEETKACLPHIQAYSFENRGHTLYFNEPEVIDMCDRFLKQFLEG